MRKVIAFLTVIIFTSTSLSFAQIPAPLPVQHFSVEKAPLTGSIEIPEEFGLVREAHWTRTNDPLVIYIQDAHAVQDAQVHIQKIIDYLQQKYGIGLVALEGGAGELDPTLFRAFPDEKTKERVLGRYLARGELSGADMAAVFNSVPAKYVGIEDWNLYEENYFAYLRAIKNKDATLEKLGEIQTELDQKRKKIYSLELNEFHEQVAAFKTGKSDLIHLVKYLGGHGDPPLLELIEKGQAAVNEISVRQLADDFKKHHLSRLDKNQLKDFNRHYQAFTTGEIDAGAFLKFLAGEAHFLGIQLNLTSEMLEMLELMKQFSMIKGTKLFEELESFLEETEKKLITTPAQKELAEKYKEIALLRDLASLELTRKQWEKFLSFPRKRESSVLERSQRHWIPAFTGMTKHDLAFYRLAAQRDRALQENLASLMQKEKTNRAIVIAGGFHSEGFKQAFKEKGFSYVVIAPKMQSLKGQELYPKLMQGGLSYKKYLKASFYDAFVKDASGQLVTSGRELKYWRDELIRTLAREGRITQAGEYTRYIDRLAAKSREQLLNEIFKELDAFKEESLNNLWDRFQSELGQFISGIRKPQPSALIQITHPALIPHQNSNRIIQYFHTGRSLGSDIDKAPPPATPAPTPAPTPNLTTMIRDSIALDHAVDKLTVETVPDPQKMRELQERLDHERVIFDKIKETMTDKGSALAVILERAQDQLFALYQRVNLAMVSIPGVDANKIAEKYNLGREFADYFKSCINEELAKARFSSAVIEDPDQPQNAYLGWRILVINIDPQWLADSLDDVISAVLTKIKNEKSREVEEKAGPDRLKDFYADIEHLRFYASHTDVYLQEIPEEDDPLHFEEEAVMKRLEAIEPKQLTREELESLFAPDQSEYFTRVDEYLGERRRILAEAARFWVEQDELERAKAKARGETRIKTASRSKASRFLELLLEDAVMKLNERLETLEKTTDPELLKVIHETVDSAVEQIALLSDSLVKRLKKNLKREKGAHELLAGLFRSFQEGRRKTVPLFNYHTRRLPRLMAPLRHIRNTEPRRRKFVKETFEWKLKQALDELGAASTDHRSGALNHFKIAYRNYRCAMEEALVLAYRDPRLEEVYKLFWVDEVVEADANGMLETWKNHILTRETPGSPWRRQREELLKDEMLRVPDLDKWIQPALFIFKRPVGDEVGVVVRVPGYPGLYRDGFAELNKGNAYFEMNHPDEIDSVYHRILSNYLKTAEAYLATEVAKTNPLGFLEGLDQVIRKIVPDPFPTNEKVEVDGHIERMPGYVMKGEGQPVFATYAVSRRTGDIYSRQHPAEDWDPTKSVTKDQLTRYETYLTATRTFQSTPFRPGPGVILARFHESDKANADQKKMPEWVHRVASVEEIRAIKAAAGSLGLDGDTRLTFAPKKVISPDLRWLNASEAPDLYGAVRELLEWQRSAALWDPEARKTRGFFRIIEDGGTVTYKVFHSGGKLPEIYSGEIPPSVLAKTDLVIIHNEGRARRPARTGSSRRSIDPNDPSSMKLVPLVVNSVPNQFWSEWRGSSGNRWWLTFNLFPIWPPKEGKPMKEQPFHMTLSRSGGRVLQTEVASRENLGDFLAYLTELNASPSLEGEELFRLGVSGLGAGASQAQAHAQLVRFPLPIENAKLTEKRRMGPVTVSSLADGWGTGLVFETDSNGRDVLTDLVVQAIRQITDKGHSFNIDVVSNESGQLRVFVSDRIRETPDGLFSNSFGWTEFGRAVVVDDPERFFERGFSLRDDVIAALNMITAPQAEIDAIIRNLHEPGASAGSLGAANILSLNEDEASHLIHKINTALQTGTLIKKRSYEIDDQVYGVELNPDFLYESTPLSLVRLGPLVFVVISGTDPVSIRSKIQEIKGQLKTKLGTYYESHQGNIFFVTTSTFSLEEAISPYSLFMIAGMLAHPDQFRNARVFEPGAGDGILSLVALRLGARRVTMVEKDASELSQARAIFEAQDFQEDRGAGGQFVLVEANLEEPGFRERVKARGLDKNTDVVLINIGPWKELYGDAHEKILELVRDWPGVRVLYDGGYLVEEEPHEAVFRSVFDQIQDRGFRVLAFTGEISENFHSKFLIAARTFPLAASLGAARETALGLLTELRQSLDEGGSSSSKIEEEISAAASQHAGSGNAPFVFVRAYSEALRNARETQDKAARLAAARALISSINFLTPAHFKKGIYEPIPEIAEALQSLLDLYEAIEAIDELAYRGYIFARIEGTFPWTIPIFFRKLRELEEKKRQALMMYMQGGTRAPLKDKDFFEILKVAGNLSFRANLYLGAAASEENEKGIRANPDHSDRERVMLLLWREFFRKMERLRNRFFGTADEETQRKNIQAYVAAMHDLLVEYIHWAEVLLQGGTTGSIQSLATDLFGDKNGRANMAAWRLLWLSKFGSQKAQEALNAAPALKSKVQEGWARRNAKLDKEFGISSEVPLPAPAPPAVSEKELGKKSRKKVNYEEIISALAAFALFMAFVLWSLAAKKVRSFFSSFVKKSHKNDQTKSGAASLGREVLAKKLLREAFESRRETAISVSGRKPQAKMIGFDWDGVFTRERGYFGTAWTALLIMTLRGADDIDPSTITSEDMGKIAEFRNRTRGMKYAQQFGTLRQMAQEAGVPNFHPKGDEEYLTKLSEIVLDLAEKDFGKDRQGWVYESSRTFLAELRARYPDLPLYVISANEEGMTQKIVSLFPEIHKHFKGIFGYPLKFHPREKRDKATILSGLREGHQLYPHEVVFFGDSPSDIKFGQEVGVVTVGVANNYENGEKLIDTGADIIVTSLAPKESLLPMLGLSASSLGETQGLLRRVAETPDASGKMRFLDEREAHRLAELMNLALDGRPMSPIRKLLIGANPFNQKQFCVEENRDLIRIGPLVFVMIDEGKPDRIKTRIEELKARLGNLYSRNQNNILFMTPTTRINPYIDMSVYTQVMIAEMLAQAQNFEGETVVDFGAGNGVLSLVALRLGARRAALIESNKAALDESRALLEAQGRDFIFIDADINSEKLDQLMEEHDLRHQAAVALVSLGAFYRDANRKALRRIRDWWNIRLLIHTGYKPDDQRHEAEFGDMLKVLKDGKFKVDVHEIQLFPDIAIHVKTMVAARPFVSMIKERFPDQTEISFADLDTGTGAFVTKFEQLLQGPFAHTEGVGVESLGFLVNQARAAGHFVVHGASESRADYESVGLTDESKDIVTINNIVSVGHRIEQADRILKPGGLLIVTFEINDVYENRQIEVAVEIALQARGYTTQRIPFPEDYPRSDQFSQAGFMLVAWRGASLGVGASGARPALSAKGGSASGGGDRRSPLQTSDRENPDSLEGKLFKIPDGAPEEITQKAREILSHGREIKEFLGISHLSHQDIFSIQYQITANEFFVLKFTVHTRSGKFVFYAKLRRFIVTEDGGERIEGTAVTDLEQALTLEASREGIAPPSMLLDDTLILRGIDDGVSLISLVNDRALLNLFLKNEEYFVRKIGKIYGRLNRKLKIRHGDIELRHIFITKQGGVYLIDFTTEGKHGPLSARLDGTSDTSDLEKLQSIFGKWAEPSGQLGRKLLDWGVSIPLHGRTYQAWLQEGYDHYDEADLSFEESQIGAASLGEDAETLVWQDREPGIPEAQLLEDLKGNDPGRLSAVRDEISTAYYDETDGGFKAGLFDKYRKLAQQGQITVDDLEKLENHGFYVDDSNAFYEELFRDAWIARLDRILADEEAFPKFDEFLRSLSPALIRAFGSFLAWYLYRHHSGIPGYSGEVGWAKTWPDDYPKRVLVAMRTRSFLKKNFSQELDHFERKLEKEKNDLDKAREQIAQRFQDGEDPEDEKPGFDPAESVGHLAGLIQKGDQREAVRLYGANKAVIRRYFESLPFDDAWKILDGLSIEKLPASSYLLGLNVIAGHFPAGLKSRYLTLGESFRKSVIYLLQTVLLPVYNYEMIDPVIAIRALKDTEARKIALWQLAEASRDQGDDYDALIRFLRQWEMEEGDFAAAQSLGSAKADSLGGRQIADDSAIIAALASPDLLGPELIRQVYTDDPTGFRDAARVLARFQNVLQNLIRHKEIGLATLRTAFKNHPSGLAELVQVSQKYPHAFLSLCESRYFGWELIREMIANDPYRLAQAIFVLGQNPDVNLDELLSRLNVIGENTFRQAFANDPYGFISAMILISENSRLNLFIQNFRMLEASPLGRDRLIQTLIQFPYNFVSSLNFLGPRGFRWREWIDSGGNLRLGDLLEKEKMTLVFVNQEVASLNATRGLIQLLGLSPGQIEIGYTDEVDEALARSRFPEYTLTQDFSPSPRRIVIHFDVSQIPYDPDEEVALPLVPFKFHIPEPVSFSERTLIRSAMNLGGERKVIVVSSPSEKEISLLLDAYDDLDPVDKPLLILGLRHEDPSLLSELKERGYRVGVRTGEDQVRSSPWTAEAKPLGDWDIVVLHTRGELLKLIASADLVIVGEDKNIFEAVSQGTPRVLAFGKYWENNRLAWQLALEAQAARRVTPAELKAQIDDLLHNPLEKSLQPERAEAALTRFEKEVLPQAKLCSSIRIAAEIFRKTGIAGSLGEGYLPGIVIDRGQALQLISRLKHVLSEQDGKLGGEDVQRMIAIASLFSPQILEKGLYESIPELEETISLVLKRLPEFMKVGSDDPAVKRLAFLVRILSRFPRTLPLVFDRMEEMNQNAKPGEMEWPWIQIILNHLRRLLMPEGITNEDERWTANIFRATDHEALAAAGFRSGGSPDRRSLRRHLSEYENLYFRIGVFLAIAASAENLSEVKRRPGDSDRARVMIFLWREFVRNMSGFKRQDPEDSGEAFRLLLEYADLVELALQGDRAPTVKKLIHELFFEEDEEDGLRAARHLFWLTKFGNEKAVKVVKTAGAVESRVRSEWDEMNRALDRELGVGQSLGEVREKIARANGNAFYAPARLSTNRLIQKPQLKELLLWHPSWLISSFAWQQSKAYSKKDRNAKIQYQARPERKITEEMAGNAQSNDRFGHIRQVFGEKFLFVTADGLHDWKNFIRRWIKRQDEIYYFINNIFSKLISVFAASRSTGRLIPAASSASLGLPADRLPDRQGQAGIEDLVGGEKTLDYLQRIREQVNPAGAIEGRKKLLYVGSSADISTALLATDATDFIFVDLFPFKGEFIRDENIRSYLANKSGYGGYAGEQTISVIGAIQPLLMKELEILGAQNVAISEQTDGKGPGVFTITFDWNGANRRLIYIGETDGKNIESYASFLIDERTGKGDLDFYLEKAGVGLASEGNSIRAEEGKIKWRVAHLFLKEGGYLITDIPSNRDSEDPLGEFHEVPVERKGAKFGYGQGFVFRKAEGGEKLSRASSLGNGKNGKNGNGSITPSRGNRAVKISQAALPAVSELPPGYREFFMEKREIVRFLGIPDSELDWATYATNKQLHVWLANRYGQHEQKTRTGRMTDEQFDVYIRLVKYGLLGKLANKHGLAAGIPSRKDVKKLVSGESDSEDQDDLAASGTEDERVPSIDLDAALYEARNRVKDLPHGNKVLFLILEAAWMKAGSISKDELVKRLRPEERANAVSVCDRLHENQLLQEEDFKEGFITWIYPAAKVVDRANIKRRKAALFMASGKLGVKKTDFVDAAEILDTKTPPPSSSARLQSVNPKALRAKMRTLLRAKLYELRKELAKKDKSPSWDWSINEADIFYIKSMLESLPEARAEELPRLGEKIKTAISRLTLRGEFIPKPRLTREEKERIRRESQRAKRISQRARRVSQRAPSPAPEIRAEKEKKIRGGDRRKWRRPSGRTVLLLAPVFVTLGLILFNLLLDYKKWRTSAYVFWGNTQSTEDIEAARGYFGNQTFWVRPPFPLSLALWSRPIVLRSQMPVIRQGVPSDLETDRIRQNIAGDLEAEIVVERPDQETVRLHSEAVAGVEEAFQAFALADEERFFPLVEKAMEKYMDVQMRRVRELESFIHAQRSEGKVLYLILDPDLADIAFDQDGEEGENGPVRFANTPEDTSILRLLIGKIRSGEPLTREDVIRWFHYMILKHRHQISDPRTLGRLEASLFRGMTAGNRSLPDAFRLASGKLREHNHRIDLGILNATESMGALNRQRQVRNERPGAAVENLQDLMSMLRLSGSLEGLVDSRDDVRSVWGELGFLSSRELQEIPRPSLSARSLGNSKGGFFVPGQADEREVEIGIYRKGHELPEKRVYREYFSPVYSDVSEFLEKQGITQAKIDEIVSGEAQSVVIGIPTYDNSEDLEGRVEYFEKVLRELELLRGGKSPYKDWPVELVINVNGLGQEKFLSRVLEFQRRRSTPDIPITVIHMPLGGRLAGEKLSGKSNAVNAIVDYAKSRKATIFGMMDDDIEFQEGNILSNIDFLVRKARELRSPVLTSSGPRVKIARTFWSRFIGLKQIQGEHSIRGTSLFSFLFSFPPLPSFPINEDMYLGNYFLDASKVQQGMDAVRWRIWANPAHVIFFYLARSFWNTLKQGYRWELADRWVFSLLSPAKRRMQEKFYPRYGLPVILNYLKNTLDFRNPRKSISDLRHTFVYFVIRGIFINHFVALELWFRQNFGFPRVSTRWAETVPPETKRNHAASLGSEDPSIEDLVGGKEKRVDIAEGESLGNGDSSQNPVQAGRELLELKRVVGEHRGFKHQGKLPVPDPDQMEFREGLYVWYLAEEVDPLARFVKGPQGEFQLEVKKLMPRVVAEEMIAFGKKIPARYEHDAEIQHVILTPEVKRKLAPVRDLQKEAVERLFPSLGWKLHLNFARDPGTTEKIRGVLEELKENQIIVTYKIGRAVSGKEATVYVGHGFVAKRVAEYLENHFGNLLKAPDVSQDSELRTTDILLAPRIAGRFDVGRRTGVSGSENILQLVDWDFAYYGSQGIPYLRAPLDDVLRRRLGPESVITYRQERFVQLKPGEKQPLIDSDRLLRERYGAFYTDGLAGSRTFEEAESASSTAESLGSVNTIRARDYLRAFDGRLTDALHDARKSIESSSDIPGLLLSGKIERGIANSLGADAELLDLSKLTERFRGVVLSEAFASEHAPIHIQVLSPEARFLIRHPEILNQILGKPFLDSGKVSYILDASFLPGPKDASRERAEAFLESLISAGSRVAIPFDTRRPAEARMAASLTRLIPGVEVVGYQEAEPLRQGELDHLSEPMLVLPAGIEFKFASDPKDWKRRGLLAEPSLLPLASLEVSEFVPLVQVLLGTESLRTQLKDASPFPILTPEILNSIIDFLNDLAKTKFAQDLMAQNA